MTKLKLSELWLLIAILTLLPVTFKWRKIFALKLILKYETDAVTSLFVFIIAVNMGQ